MRVSACASACVRARNSNAPPMLRDGRANALPRSASAACLTSSMGRRRSPDRSRGSATVKRC